MKKAAGDWLILGILQKYPKKDLRNEIAKMCYTDFIRNEKRIGGIEMKKVCGKILAICLLAAALCGCRSYEDVSMILGADVDMAKVMMESDTHGGFHGDGIRYIEFTFADDSFLQKIQADNTWHALPVQEWEITALLYGTEQDGVSYGAALCDDEGAPLFPTVENGYYLFYDRHAESETPFSGTGVLERNSYNFTIALYDADTNMLYYAELDT